MALPSSTTCSIDASICSTASAAYSPQLFSSTSNTILQDLSHKLESRGKQVCDIKMSEEKPCIYSRWVSLTNKESQTYSHWEPNFKKSQKPAPIRSPIYKRSPTQGRKPICSWKAQRLFLISSMPHNRHAEDVRHLWEQIFQLPITRCHADKKNIS